MNVKNVKKERIIYGQSFNKLEKEYCLNEKTDKLEPTGEYIDLQEKLNSNKDNTLDKLLDKYLNNVNDVSCLSDVLEGSLNKNYEDLLDIAEFYEQTNDIRQKYNLSDELTIKQVYEQVDLLKKQYENDLKNNDIIKEYNEKEIQKKQSVFVDKEKKENI